MVVELDHGTWDGPAAADVARDATTALERGTILCCAALPFVLATDEQRRLFALDTGLTSKNVGYAPDSGRITGVRGTESDGAPLAATLARFSRSAASLARTLFPTYAARLVVARASFRPVEIAGRQISWRKDDRRLHVDSFPSSPTGGRRILRVFANVNPHGRSRTWRIGGPFTDVVSRYQTRLRLPWPGEAALLRALRITKSRRTAYDALMLQLHDLMKRDEAYQRETEQTTWAFAPGTAWIAFTDTVSHAAIAGQYQFEQTLLVPVDAMNEPQRAPLRVLERALGRSLSR